VRHRARIDLTHRAELDEITDGSLDASPRRGGSDAAVTKTDPSRTSS
jgi:hypothetical protein